MKSESHIKLGEILSNKYLKKEKKRCKLAFSIGCIEPDRNPFTYLKGSIRAQWLRGHNFDNSKDYVEKKLKKIENKKKYNVFDYYTIGKIIHYTTDSFTAAHNNFFPSKLSIHNSYEHDLQKYFLSFLNNPSPTSNLTKWNAKREYKRRQEEYQYEHKMEVKNDAEYAFVACMCIMMMLFPK